MGEGLIPYTGASQTYLTLQRVKGRHLQQAIQAIAEGEPLYYREGAVNHDAAVYPRFKTYDYQILESGAASSR